jgi:hypothetical protein
MMRRKKRELAKISEEWGRDYGTRIAAGGHNVQYPCADGVWAGTIRGRIFTPQKRHAAYKKAHTRFLQKSLQFETCLVLPQVTSSDGGSPGEETCCSRFGDIDCRAYLLFKSAQEARHHLDNLIDILAHATKVVTLLPPIAMAARELLQQDWEYLMACFETWLLASDATLTDLGSSVEGKEAKA